MFEWRAMENWELRNSEEVNSQFDGFPSEWYRQLAHEVQPWHKPLAFHLGVSWYSDLVVGVWFAYCGVIVALVGFLVCRSAYQFFQAAAAAERPHK